MRKDVFDRPPWKVVGHRGYAASYPENTLIAMEAGVASGADAVELDVQLTRDQVPVVIHDANLLRTCGIDKDVAHLESGELQDYSCHYPALFDQRFFPVPLLSLDAVCTALAVSNPLVFIEIKEESIPIAGRQVYLKAVLSASSALGSNRVIISFDREILEIAKRECDLPIGWCLDAYSQDHLAQAQKLNPEMLICCEDQPGEEPLWPGPWEWFVYGIARFEEAEYWHKRGATWIEADDPTVAIKCSQREFTNGRG